MREYSGGSGTVKKRFGKDGKGVWYGCIRYREVYENELDERGKPKKGKWEFLYKTLNVKAYNDGDNNRGRKTALEEWRKWREQLIADEPARAAQEQAERETSGFVTSSSTVAEYMDYYLLTLPTKKKHDAQHPIEKSTLSGYYRRAGYISKDYTCEVLQSGSSETRVVEINLGKVKLRDLTKSAVEQFRNGMLEQYQPKTVCDTIVLLRSALDDAVDGGLIDKNPASAVKCPELEKKEVCYIEEGERARLLDDLNATLRGEGLSGTHGGKPAALGAKLALLTGMRRGEVCGLRWRDVDFQHGFICVRTAIGTTSSGFYEKTTKTNNGKRDIPLDDDNGLLSDLKARREDMQAQAEQAGVKLSNDTFVIGTVDGAYMQPRVLYRDWQRRAKRLQLTTNQGTVPTFHDLRHTFATVMVYGGCPEITLKNIMGHGDIATTHRYYTAVDKDADRRAVQGAMRRALYGVTADNVIEFPRTGTEG